MKKQPLTLAKVRQSEDPQRQLSHLRRVNTQLGNHIRRLNERLGDRKEFQQDIVSAVAAAEPFPRFKLPTRGKDRPNVWPVLKLSDWHIGEVVEENETEGFNKFDWQIAQNRVFGLCEDFLKWVEAQRVAYKIEQCAVLCEGDYVSGDIHQELLVTNEFPLPVQTSKAGLLLGEVLRILAGRFKRVHVKFVGADNHSRLTRKPQAKQKSSNSMSYLVHTIAQSKVEKCTNIQFDVATGMTLLTDINGVKFLIEHGDTMKGWAGIPYYGFNRQMGKEAMRRMNTDKGFHFFSIGHWHEPNIIGGKILVNGSLSGTTEFDHACGRFSPPTQVAFLVHPEHRVFNWVAFALR